MGTERPVTLAGGGAGSSRLGCRGDPIGARPGSLPLVGPQSARELPAGARLSKRLEPPGEVLERFRVPVGKLREHQLDELDLGGAPDEPAQVVHDVDQSLVEFSAHPERELYLGFGAMGCWPGQGISERRPRAP